MGVKTKEMKRINLYRGKRLDNGQWIEGSLIGEDVIVGKIVDFEEDYFTTEFWYKVAPETVGQFTGMTDKNGTKIFEGDIVRHIDTMCHVVEVVNSEVYFDTEKLEFGFRYSNELFHCQSNNEFEVIGNIHDNKELLS